MSNTNTYLDQVVRQQEQLEADLRSKRSVAPAQAAGGGAPSPRERSRAVIAESQGHQPAPNAVEVRVTGFARWKTVLVPPNAFVVHTRRGKAEPLHVGLGVSFRYNPATDSYL